MEQIFGRIAKQYYDAGLPVIPLHYHEKKPIPQGWNSLSKTLPDVPTQEQWIKNHPSGNIGLVLGEASNLCAVDIDHEDEKIQQVIIDCLPVTEWVRIGQKGMILLYKRNPKLKNRNIKAADGSMIVELLCNARQMVLPPSIHPKTKLPYTANRDLLEALPNLVPLPDDVEDRIRAALINAGVKLSQSGVRYGPTEYISRGGRDNMMTHLAGRYAFDIRMGNLTVKDAITFMENWAEVNVEKVIDDDIDVNKGVHLLANFILSDVNENNYVLPLGWDKDLSTEDKQKLGLVFDEANEAWTFDQIIEYLKERFESTSEHSPERRDSVTFILNKLAKTPNPDALTESRVLKYIQKNTRDGVTASNYQKEINKIRKGPIEGDNHQEIAEAAIEKYSQRQGLLRFWEGQFWSWGGDHWRPVNPEEIARFIGKEFGTLAAAKKANDHDQIVKAMRRACDQYISKSRPTGVNFINGFVDENLKIHDHAPEQGMTYVLPYRYMPEKGGDFPKFSQLLDGYWGKDKDYKEKVRALQEAMCATVLGLGAKYQRAFLLYGVGGSGKSQLLDIVSELVPESAKAVVKPDMWKKPEAVVHIHEKLLNIAGELSEKARIPGDIFKQIIDGSELTGKFLYRNYFSFRPKAAHWFASNHYPRSNDTSEGFFRRWLIFDFNRVIPEEEKVLDFGKQIVEEEIEAIVAWALDAYLEFKNETDYTLPASHHRHISLLKTNNSTVLDFLINCKEVEFGAKCQCKITELYDAYYNFITKTFEKPVQPQRFFQEISMIPEKDRGFSLVDNHGEEWYVGIKPKF